MKRVFALIAILMIALTVGCGAPIAGNSFAQNATAEPTPQPSFDFRNISWGMTLEEVKKSETAELIDEDEVALLYSIEDVAGLPATLIYSFQNEKLVLGSYSFNALHSNANDYIDDYNNVKEALTELYGAPFVDKQVWKDDLFKDDPSSYGLAVSAGQLLYAAQWKTETTNIVLGLSGDNYEISHRLIYTTLDYKPETNTGGL